MKKKLRIVEYLVVLFILFLFSVVIGKYISSGFGSYISDYYIETKYEISRIWDNSFGKCDGNKEKFLIEGGYICETLEERNLADSEYKKIFETYPLSVDGKEVIYSFLDEGDLSIADKMLNDVYDVDSNRYQPVYLEDITWIEDPYDQNYWRLLFYSLRPTNNLIYAWKETDDDRYRKKLEEIIDSYLTDGINKEETWSDNHAVAFRAMVLTNVWWKLREEKALSYDLNNKLLEGIKKHGDYLFDDNHYEANYNHGINEAAALLVMAENFPDLTGALEWKQKAIKRLANSATDLIDKDGSLIENSPYYQFYVLSKYAEIESYSKRYDVKISDDFSLVVKKMVDYSLYLIKPDLSVPLVGASIATNVHLNKIFKLLINDNSEFYYAITQGKKGTKPKSRNIFFENAGKTIMRSSWGDESNFSNQTYLFFNIGAYRTIHSDYDALNFILYSKGRDLIVDSGLYSYEKSELKEYFDGTLAHNTVVVDDKDQFAGAVSKGDFYEDDNIVQQSASHDLYLGVSHYRNISLIGSDDVFIVDKLASNENHDYKQMFHLAFDLSFTQEGTTLYVTDSSGQDVMQIKQVAVSDSSSLNIVSGQENPLEGWCSNKYEEKEPCNSISYRQQGTEAFYFTHIHIGVREDSGTVTYNDKSQKYYFYKQDNYYEMDLSVPDTFSINQVEKNEITVAKNTASYSLIKKDNGNWEIVDENGNQVSDYFVSDVSGNLAINRVSNDGKFSVSLEDLENYYSVSNVAVTDIDYKNGGGKMYEQEDYLPILGYHHVIDDDQIIQYPESQIKLSDFSAQMDYFNNTLGCRWYTFSDIMENYVLPGNKIPELTCVINFDDGRENNYSNAFPVLEREGIKGSFYIITGSVGKGTYMNWEQVDELYAKGNEIGSHTIGGGSLEAFFGDNEEIDRQIEASKIILEQHGFGEVKTLAYPLGVWNDYVVESVKKAGYIAARDTSQDNTWRDTRSTTVSFDPEYIWHMHYYKPEKDTPEALAGRVWYNGWWQFEEGYRINSDLNDNIVDRSSDTPTPTSFGMVSLPDKGDSISNKFIVRNQGYYNIEVFMATTISTTSTTSNFSISLDKKNIPIEDLSINESSCIKIGRYNYCLYNFGIGLGSGTHTITVKTEIDNVMLDKFRMYRWLTKSKGYNIKITEISEEEEMTINNSSSKQVKLIISKNKYENEFSLKNIFIDIWEYIKNMLSFNQD